jgi:hypothetical protein
LELSAGNELDIKSNIMNFMALFSKSRGRCFYKENNSIKSNENVVDILFNANDSCQLSGCSVSLRYDVVVKSNDKILIRHGDEISSIKFKMFIGDNEINEITALAGKIPEALRRDIQKTGKTVP